MDPITVVVVIVGAAAGLLAFTLWKKATGLEASLAGETRALEDKRGELEKVKKESRDRRDESEDLKKQLQEAKNKLKKRERDTERESQPSKSTQGRKPQKAEDPALQPLAPMVVRISDQELSAEHGRTVARLEGEMETLRAELEEFKRREANMKREAERAANALKAAAEGEAQQIAAPVEAKKPEDEVQALKAQLDVMTRAAIENERKLKKELRQAEEGSRHALRRASNNAQLYQVIKGQIELMEDKLAAYKLKYEGAKSIDELRKDSRRERGPKGRRGTSGRGRPQDDARATNENGGGHDENVVAHAENVTPASDIGSGADEGVAPADVSRSRPESGSRAGAAVLSADEAATDSTNDARVDSNNDEAPQVASP